MLLKRPIKIDLLNDPRALAGQTNGSYSPSVFKWLLQLEQQRNRRSGGTVCLLEIDLKSLAPKNGRPAVATLSNGTVEKVLDVIRLNARHSDIFTRMDQKVKLILTDTSRDGACTASRRIISRIENTISSKGHATNGRRVEAHVQTWDYRENATYASVLQTEDRGTVEMPTVEKIAINTLGSTSFFEATHHSAALALGLKRWMDFILAVLGLLVLLPVMAIIAVAIKVSSPGPVLFKQERVGRNGKFFTFFKFRSMYDDADDWTHREYVTKLIKGKIMTSSSESKTPLYKLDNDSRITRVGQVLRSLSLDELPQLFNVIKGEMSLVGPRPAIPYEVDNYDSWHLQRLEVLPGITGLWQVKGRSKTTFAEMVRLDIQYIREWSLWLDVKILLSTVKAVFSREGAL